MTGSPQKIKNDPVQTATEQPASHSVVFLSQKKMLLKFLQHTQLLQQRHAVLRSLLIQIQAVVIRRQQCRLHIICDGFLHYSSIGISVKSG